MKLWKFLILLFFIFDQQVIGTKLFGTKEFVVDIEFYENAAITDKTKWIEYTKSLMEVLDGSFNENNWEPLETTSVGRNKIVTDSIEFHWTRFYAIQVQKNSALSQQILKAYFFWSLVEWSTLTWQNYNKSNSVFSHYNSLISKLIKWKENNMGTKTSPSQLPKLKVEFSETSNEKIKKKIIFINFNHLTPRFEEEIDKERVKNLLSVLKVLDLNLDVENWELKIQPPHNAYIYQTLSNKWNEFYQKSHGKNSGFTKKDLRRLFFAKVTNLVLFKLEPATNDLEKMRDANLNYNQIKTKYDGWEAALGEDLKKPIRDEDTNGLTKEKLLVNLPHMVIDVRWKFRKLTDTLRTSAQDLIERASQAVRGE